MVGVVITTLSLLWMGVLEANTYREGFCHFTFHGNVKGHGSVSKNIYENGFGDLNACIDHVKNDLGEHFDFGTIRVRYRNVWERREISAPIDAIQIWFRPDEHSVHYYLLK